MDTETQRNLGTNLAGITGKGYDTAYQNAMAQYNQDLARRMQARQATEQSKQFGAGQGMTAAQQAAQYGLAGQQAGEASRQFGANLGLQGLNTGLQGSQAQGGLGIYQEDSCSYSSEGQGRQVHDTRYRLRRCGRCSRDHAGVWFRHSDRSNGHRPASRRDLRVGSQSEVPPWLR
jgi:hypothetical protein